MAKVQLGNVVVLDNPSPFLNPFQFELTFECIEELKEGKLSYNAKNSANLLGIELCCILKFYWW